MQPETIITFEKVLDQVVIETKEYNVYTTLGLTARGDFYVGLEFINLDMPTLGELVKLYKEPKALTFKSKLAEQESYNITHIVVEKLRSNSQLEMTWECLSDDPSFSLIIE